MSGIEDPRAWFQREKAGRVIEALEKRGFDASYMPDSGAARERVLDLIASDASIGIGGSLTLRETGIIDALRERGNRFITDPAEPLGPVLLEQRRQALTCDAYLTSTNAITEDGRLVNIDGIGNRVASMVFGPRTVIIVAGMNKVTGSLEDAIERARQYAAVLNARRLGVKVPCATSGRCSDCKSPERICRVLTVMEACPGDTAVKVLLVEESLGF